MVGGATAAESWRISVTGSGCLPRLSGTSMSVLNGVEATMVSLKMRMPIAWLALLAKMLSPRLNEQPEFALFSLTRADVFSPPSLDSDSTAAEP